MTDDEAIYERAICLGDIMRIIELERERFETSPEHQRLLRKLGLVDNPGN